jgi:hypothetical protein
VLFEALAGDLPPPAPVFEPAFFEAVPEPLLALAPAAALFLAPPELALLFAAPPLPPALVFAALVFAAADPPDFPLVDDLFPPAAVLTTAPAAPTTAPVAAPARISPATSFALPITVPSTPLPPDPFLDFPPDFFGADFFVVAAMTFSILRFIFQTIVGGVIASFMPI